MTEIIDISLAEICKLDFATFFFHRHPNRSKREYRKCHRVKKATFMTALNIM